MAIIKMYNPISKIAGKVECPTDFAYFQVGEFLRQARAVKITTEQSLGVEIAEVDSSGAKIKTLTIENRGTNLNLLKKLKTFLIKFQEAKTAVRKAVSLSTGYF